MFRSLASTVLRSFDFSGTASRREYWTYIAFLAVISVVLWVLVDLSLPGSRGKAIGMVALILLTLPIYALTVRRLHDIGRSGYWAWFAFLGYLGFFVLFFFMVRRSVDEPAEWPRRKRHIVGQCAVGLVAMLGMSRLIWEPYYIPSGSMKPTLLVGDYLTTTLGYKTAQRGDIVVFRHPVTDVAFVARIIGLSGDVVALENGQVILDEGQGAARLPQVAQGDFVERYERQGPQQSLPFCGEKNIKPGDICTKDLFVETLPSGRSFEILNVFDDARFDTFDPIVVPQDHVFLLGDHRDNSADSRAPQQFGGFGTVPLANIVGKVERVVFSSAGQFLWDVTSWRKDRLWKRID